MNLNHISSSPCHLNRRRFLQSASAATALAALPSWGADAIDLVNGPSEW